MKYILFLAFMSGCATSGNTYMSAAVEIKCPLIAKDRDCYGAAEQVCHGGYSVIGMGRTHTARTVYVACQEYNTGWLAP